MHFEFWQALVPTMDQEDAVLTRPSIGVTDRTVHAGIKSPIVLLNPESTVEAVSGGFSWEEVCSLTS
jgi:hypothetical protein